ncbi:MAG TPA: oligosaccharide flippase family protein [Blastocatellia bacterium]|nr:oligosaccharide flippase family protein [Blastocatellia bacterium]
MMQSTTIKASEPETQATDVARVAGRGTIYITASKLWFLASGAAIYYVLTRLMSREQFGLYQVVTGIVSIVNAVVVTGTSQTVSKYISQDESKADSVKSKALRLQLSVGGGLALLFAALAPVVADYLNDSGLTNYLRLAALITLSYSFYSVYTGYFNGQKKFLTQAGLDMTYSTMKLAFIVLLVWLGFGVAGAIGGFALAAACILGVSAIAAGRGGRKGEVRTRDLFAFQINLLLFTLVLNLLQKTDLILVKALSSPDAKIASDNAGSYGAAVYVANITFQVIISATFVIFPLVSQSTFANDLRRTQVYVSNTIRYTLMIMALLATLFSANAGGVMSVIYPEAYKSGAVALGIVAFGMLFFGLFYVMTTIISASGRPKVSLIIGALTLAASAGSNALLIPRYGIRGAAIATTASMLLGVLAGGGYLIAKFNALVPGLSLLRIAFCAGAVYAASLAFAPDSKLLIIGKLIVLSLVYVALLAVSREIGRDDLAALKKVAGK